MASKDKEDTPEDTRDALEVLDAEAKEFEKVRPRDQRLDADHDTNTPIQDAEINRILGAFRLDA